MRLSVSARTGSLQRDGGAPATRRPFTGSGDDGQARGTPDPSSDVHEIERRGTELPSLEAPSRASAGTAAWRSHAAPSRQRLPVLAIHDHRPAANALAHFMTPSAGRGMVDRMRCGSAAKSSSVRTSTSAGHFSVRTRRASLSTEILLGDDWQRPLSSGEERNGLACQEPPLTHQLPRPLSALHSRPAHNDATAALGEQ
jgi:hypothetical protein